MSQYSSKAFPLPPKLHVHLNSLAIPTLSRGYYQSTSYLYRFTFSGCFIEIGPCNMCVLQLLFFVAVAVVTPNNITEIHPCCSKSTSTSFLFLFQQRNIVWTHHIFLIYSPVDGNWGHYHFPAIMTNATINIPIQDFLQDFVWTYIVFSLRWIPKSSTGNTGNSNMYSYGEYMFNFLINCQTFVQSSYTTDLPTSRMGVSCVSHPRRHLLLSSFGLKPLQCVCLKWL